MFDNLVTWLRWMGTGGHPDQINPDERFMQAASAIEQLSTENKALKSAPSVMQTQDSGASSQEAIDVYGIGRRA